MDEFHRQTPAGWLESLEISEKQAAASETVPYSDVKRGLRESMERVGTNKETTKIPADK